MPTRLPWEDGKKPDEALDFLYSELGGPVIQDPSEVVIGYPLPARKTRMLSDIAEEAGLSPKAMQMRLARAGIKNIGKRGKYDDNAELTEFLGTVRREPGIVIIGSTNRRCYEERYILDLLVRGLRIEREFAAAELEEIKDAEEAPGKYRAEPAYRWLGKKRVDVLKLERRAGYRLYEIVIELGLARGEDFEYTAGVYHIKKGVKAGALKLVNGLYPKAEADKWVSGYWKKPARKKHSK